MKCAESLVQPRPRPDRSLSPDSAAEYWAEARRLASYPNARIPDSTSLPAIERFDFPAPPSPAVVMIEKRKEFFWSIIHWLINFILSS
ncbi:hypothetical protein X801_07193 [Opisthorchis viverrini]|uniref:Uncharacterized protein n=1 Tax=Opisthorchis viverrini TaxID=6198 RepID=A0A1S8WR51_OPIVI|nr:hypothetical protein X801_07193 [Opisthorchis viverrini]